ncbi:hypothetical protein GDO86_005618 [Hymenochirus boettgeri]|uniref:Apoptotic protease-activating factor 1 n=1 Tax=Hymenochirus boettgeri TaxID=247094 RepID=A0A8T2J7P8_9PIPI|nr:hypothetical protein GDO86_005618 [Hymenochirus boettgeri]
MDEKARSLLLQNKIPIARDIRTAYIMDHMIRDEVITPEEEAKVKSQPTPFERANFLINLILDKSKQAYISFYNALRHEGYKDLALLLKEAANAELSDTLKSSNNGITSYVKTAVCEGGVPQRPVVFVERPEHVHKIQKSLYRLKDDPGWITVYGMAGCGKSVLAAEALRDHNMLKDCFPGGVHWVSVGKLDNAGLLMKLQNVCTRLDQDGKYSHRPPLNIEGARDQLRLLVNRMYPRSLLILDDVWDSWALKAFDIQCRVLITSRDKSVTDPLSGFKEAIHVDSELEHSKGLEILACFVDMEVALLPNSAHSIIKVSKGSPLVISLIGALLREFPNRWDFYLTQLKKKQFKRIRKSSSYDYEALDEAMSISVDMLKEEFKKYYNYFSVIEKDVKVPTQVLCILWNMEREDVEDMLQEFVNKSLLYCDRNGKSFYYYLHDLQLDYLTERNRDRLDVLHAKFVDQYKKHYLNIFPTWKQEDCVYWYRYLAYHMAQANMHQDLCSLLFSLNWIKSKTELFGPAHLIHEFVQYRNILDNQNTKAREHFQEFLSVNGHLLGLNPEISIVQLGLGQPEDSEVYRQAILQAREELKSGAFYVKWMNKQSIKNLPSLVVRPHKEAVFYTCFSPDGKKIAACGADKTLQVFKSETGEKLLEIEAHEDEVLCCAFSADEKLIATCSDRKVKIWNAKTGNLIREYEEHSEQVNCCQFSSGISAPLLATCSNDHLIKIWNSKKEYCQNTLFGHTQCVYHCRFSPDDQYLASSSMDGTLKIWDANSPNYEKSIDVVDKAQPEVLLKCCCWSNDGAKIMVTAREFLYVFETDTCQRLFKIKACHQILYCDFCSSNPIVALALSRYIVQLWDIDSRTKIADFNAHLSWVYCVKFSPKGFSFLTSSDDQTVKIWETSKVCKPSATNLKREFDVSFNGEETLVLSSSKDGHILLINGNTGDTKSKISVQEKQVTCCCLSAVCQLAAIGFGEGTVQVFNLSSGKILQNLKGHSSTVQHCQFTEDGKCLVSSSDDSTIRVWDVASGQSLTLEGHKEAVKCFKIFQNSLLLSWSFDGTVKVWDIANGEGKKEFSCHTGAVLSCDISPDLTKFSSTSADQSAKIWSLETSVLLYELIGHQGCVRCCRFSWDNKYLATGDDKSKIMWWEVDSGACKQTFYTDGTDLKSIQLCSLFRTFVTIDNLGILYVLQLID